MVFDFAALQQLYTSHTYVVTAHQYSFELIEIVPCGILVNKKKKIEKNKKQTKKKN